MYRSDRHLTGNITGTMVYARSLLMMTATWGCQSWKPLRVWGIEHHTQLMIWPDKLATRFLRKCHNSIYHKACFARYTHVQSSAAVFPVFFNYKLRAFNVPGRLSRVLGLEPWGFTDDNIVPIISTLLCQFLAKVCFKTISLITKNNVDPELNLL